MRIFLVLAISFLLVGCSDRPRGAVKGVLDVAMTAKFDPMHGMKSTKYFFVTFDDKKMSLVIEKGSLIVGQNDRSMAFLSGTKILTAGEIRDGVYYANYLEFLD